MPLYQLAVRIETGVHPLRIMGRLLFDILLFDCKLWPPFKHSSIQSSSDVARPLDRSIFPCLGAHSKLGQARSKRRETRPPTVVLQLHSALASKYEDEHKSAADQEQLRNLADEPGILLVSSMNRQHSMYDRNRASHDPELCNASVVKQTAFTQHAHRDGTQSSQRTTSISCATTSKNI